MLASAPFVPCSEAAAAARITGQITGVLAFAPPTTRCPWAARLQRVERLAAETERLVESVERLGVRFHGAEVGASRHLAELFTDSP